MSSAGAAAAAEPGVRRVTCGSPLRGAGSNCRLHAITHRRPEARAVQRVVEAVVELHDGGLVAAAVAVVWRAEDGHDVLLVRPVVALHHQLVRARHERQVVVVVEHV